MKNMKRLLSMNYAERMSLRASELKEAIKRSEGRVICAQTNAIASPLLENVSNAELAAAMGSDLILLNAYHMKEERFNSGLHGLTVPQMIERTRNLVGLFLECSTTAENMPHPFDTPEFIDGRVASEENIQKSLELGARFLIIGGNPGMGTRFDAVLTGVQRAKKAVEDRCLIMAGKWEEGVDEKVFGDPLADYDEKAMITALIQAGADVIIFAAPGSRPGVTVESIRELVTHTHRQGALAMCLLGASVEGATEETVSLFALKMKETGADIHAIGDAGYSGVAMPENIFAMSVAIRGKRLTYQRMAGRNR